MQGCPAQTRLALDPLHLVDGVAMAPLDRGALVGEGALARVEKGQLPIVRATDEDVCVLVVELERA